jgi:hypothetical protein
MSKPHSQIAYYAAKDPMVWFYAGLFIGELTKNHVVDDATAAEIHAYLSGLTKEAGTPLAEGMQKAE